ncbi:MAG: hypothetical protein CMN78_03385 [Spirochaetales bacterium]|nr:hypothetical protein [Spirochaetales bacterium]
MKTHDHARRTLARLMRAYHADELDEKKFRAMIYGFATLLGYFKHAADLRIEERLEAIEDQLSEDNRR